MFSLCVTLMFSVRSEIVITGVGMNSLCNFTKYYSCEISLNVNFKGLAEKGRKCSTGSGSGDLKLPDEYARNVSFERVHYANARMKLRPMKGRPVVSTVY